MRRREFILGLGGAAAMSLEARAQERVRRVGVLMNTSADHPDGKSRLAIFQQGLQALGWTAGQNVRFETRGAVGIADNYREYAAELVALEPDVCAIGNPFVHPAKARVGLNPRSRIAAMTALLSALPLPAMNKRTLTTKSQCF